MRASSIVDNQGAASRTPFSMNFASRAETQGFGLLRVLGRF
jgi:hypothetical protein